MALLFDSAQLLNIHESSFLSESIMRARAKVPLSICSWIWIKLSFSPSFVTGYFWAHYHESMGMMCRHMQGDHLMWKDDGELLVWVRICIHTQLLTFSLQPSSLVVGPSANLSDEEEWDKEVIDSSINQLVTHHLLTCPGRVEHGASTVFVVCTFLILFAVAHFNLLHWLLSACFGWQPYRA